jgi:hypothetical protein
MRPWTHRAAGHAAERDPELGVGPEAPRVESPALSSNRRDRWLATAGSVLVLALFFAPVFGPLTFVYRDTGRLHVPMKRWMGEELAHLRLPQWNPYSGLGTPVVPNAIDGPQHPFNVFLAAWPESGLEVWILCCYVAAALGAMAWARSVGLRWAAATVTSVAFALSGPLVSASDNVTYLTSYVALPWAFAGLQAWLDGGRLRALAGVAGAGALGAAGGDPQAWGVMLAVFVPYALAFSPRTTRSALARSLVAVLATLVASAPFVLPIVLWLPWTSRAAGLDPVELQRWNLHPNRLPELFVPELFRGGVGESLSPVFQAFCGNSVTPLPWFLSVYLGAAVLALSAMGIAAERRVRWLALGALVLLWGALGPNAGFGQVASRLPVLASFRFWEKLTVWVALAAALAAGFGARALLDGRAARFPRFAAATAALLLGVAGLAAFALGPLPGPGRDEAIVSALYRNLGRGALHAGLVLAVLATAAYACARRRHARLAPVGIALVVAADLFGGNGGAYVLGRAPDPRPPPLAAALGVGTRVVTPFELREDRWPERGPVQSRWDWGWRTLAPAWNVPLRIGSARDYVGLAEERWSRLYKALVADAKQSARFGVLGFGHVVVPGDPQNARRAGVSGPLQIVASDPELPAWVIEMPHRPRAYLATSVHTSTAEEAFDFVLRGDPAGRDVVVEHPLPEGWTPAEGTARLTGDAPTEVRIETETRGDGLLVLNDLWAPGWSATVDGASVPIVRANWAVRALRVPAGRHQVLFRYRTPGLLAGWAIALAGALALAAWGVARQRSHRAVAPSVESS